MLKKCHIIALPVILFLSCITPLRAVDSPVIAAAASVKFALQDIAAAFKQSTGKTVRFSFASSGNLTRQIQQGAPFEMFLSANTEYIEQLQEQNLAQNNKMVYALGRLVILTTKDSPLSLDEKLISIQQHIENKSLKRFAIANPEHAPYGIAAQETLQHQKLWTEIQPFLVLGENVAQATQFASSGAAQAGLVSYSLALAPALNKKISFIVIPHNYHRPLAQTMVLLNNAGETAKQFYHYLQQARAHEILSRYGFTAP